jgi:hypothetical protein
MILRLTVQALILLAVILALVFAGGYWQPICC